MLAKRIAGIAFMVALALMTAILLASLVIDNPALQQISDAVVYLAIATIAIYLTWLYSRRKEIRKRR